MAAASSDQRPGSSDAMEIDSDMNTSDSSSANSPVRLAAEAHHAVSNDHTTVEQFVRQVLRENGKEHRADRVLQVLEELDTKGTDELKLFNVGDSFWDHCIAQGGVVLTTSFELLKEAHRKQNAAVQSEAVLRPWQPYAIPTQGIQSNDPFVLPRDALVRTICGELQRNNSVRVSSPPASGKTSLAQLVMEYMHRETPARRVYKVSCAHFTTAVDDSRLANTENTLLHDLRVPSWDALNNSTIIFDDSTFIFHGALGIKLLKHILPLHNLKILFLNAFYSPVLNSLAPQVDVLLGYKELLLSEEEEDTLFAKYMQHEAYARHRGWLAHIVPRLRRHAQGHCGIIRGVLHHMFFRFQKETPSPDEAVAYYLSGEFMDDIKYLTRRWFSTVLQAIPNAVIVLSKVLSGEVVPVPNPVVIEEAELDRETVTTRALIRHTVLVEYGRGRAAAQTAQLGFASDFHRWFYSKELYPSRCRADIEYKSIEDMAIAILSTFTAAELRDPGSHGASCWKEGHLQHLFLRGALWMNPPKVRVSSEFSGFGPVKAEGECDFVVNSQYGYAFELMVGNGNIQEHLRRGQPGGIYASFRFRQYRVLHFKYEPWRPANTDNPNYISVTVAQNCQTATVTTRHGSTIVNFHA